MNNMSICQRTSCHFGWKKLQGSCQHQPHREAPGVALDASSRLVAASEPRMNRVARVIWAKATALQESRCWKCL